MDKETTDYYSPIPDFIMQDKCISARAKLLYGKISVLCDQKGYCWATNNYFADLYRVDKRTIQRWITELVKCGYVVKKIKYADDNKTVLERFISIPGGVKKKFVQCGLSASDKNATSSCQDCHEGNDIFATAPSDKNVTYNNTSFEKINERDGGKSLSLSQKKFKAAFPQKAIDCKFDDSKYDINLLIEKVSASEFLSSQANITLKSCLKLYNKIMADGYQKVGAAPAPCSFTQNITTKTPEQLNSLFTQVTPEDI